MYKTMITIKQADWQPIPQKIILVEKTVYIFKTDVTQYYSRISDKYLEILSKKELAKSLRYIRKADRERYIAGKYFLRSLLSEIMSISAGEIEFNYTADKKPFIIGVEFNVSHSGNYVVTAIGKERVGIDIELVNLDFDFEPLLPNNFSNDEAAFIKDKAANFYQLWTRKEALLKATGEGITNNLDKVPCLGQTGSQNNTDYSLTSFTVDDNYIACLATPVTETNVTILFYE
jgi:4'-phosphopantetheinyl transferase